MTNISKKEIRQHIEDSITQALLKMELAMPSKKTQKLLRNASKPIAEQIKLELKKSARKVKEVVKVSTKGPKKKGVKS